MNGLAAGFGVIGAFVLLAVVVNLLIGALTILGVVQP